jgi:hypothetical protein
MEEKLRHGDGGGAEWDIERLPADLLAHVLSLLPSFRDLSMYEELFPSISIGFAAAVGLIRSAFEPSGRGV